MRVFARTIGHFLCGTDIQIKVFAPGSVPQRLLDRYAGCCGWGMCINHIDDRSACAAGDYGDCDE